MHSKSGIHEQHKRQSRTTGDILNTVGRKNANLLTALDQYDATTLR